MKINLLKIFGIILGCVLFLCACLPKILSSSFAKFFIEKTVQKYSKNHKISYEKLTLSWQGPQQVKNLSISSTQMHVAIENLSLKKNLLSLLFLHKNIFASTSPREFSFENIQLQLKNAPSIDIFFSEGFFRKENGQAILSLTGHSKKNPLTVEVVQSSKENLHFNISLKEFPLELLEPLFKQKSPIPFTKLIASPLSLQAQGELEKGQGEIFLDAYTKNLQATCSFDKQKNHVFLKKDLKVIYQPTEDFFHLLCQKIELSPFFKKPFVAQSPIELHLCAKNNDFSFPFSLDTSNFEGQFYLKSFQATEGSTLRTVLSILTKTFFLEKRTVDVLSTPVDFNLKKEWLTLERVDFLLNQKVHLCLWGKVHLGTEEIDLTIGIPKDTLWNWFHFHSVPDDFVLHIPLKGTLKSPDLKKKEAIAKISALALSQIKQKFIPLDLFSLSKELGQLQTPRQKYFLPKPQTLHDVLKEPAAQRK